jgi:membrane protein
MLLLANLLRRAFTSAINHDALTLGQATAYSAIVALFPALIVAAAVVSYLPDTQPLRFQIAAFFDHILPRNVSPLFGAYFVAHHKSPRTGQALLGSLFVSLSGAASVVATLMEGFRRAHGLPLLKRNFWSRRLRALALVPLALLPLAAVSLLVVFGHFLTHWLTGKVDPEVRTIVFILADILRWAVPLAGSVGIIAVIYHLGTDISKDLRDHMQPWLALRMDWSWRASLPGATLATVLWFLATLLFGLYVTRFANYSQVYGSLGAAIALLFWLYLIALCVLIGAEFNAQLVARRKIGQYPQPPAHL